MILLSKLMEPQSLWTVQLKYFTTLFFSIHEPTAVMDTHCTKKEDSTLATGTGQQLYCDYTFQPRQRSACSLSSTDCSAVVDLIRQYCDREVIGISCTLVKKKNFKQPCRINATNLKLGALAAY